jgi:ubiquinone/menaquinone biosynthesis C-methylase UbiE
VRRIRRLLLMDAHTCPWWLGYTFDNPLRRALHDPERILSGLVRQGQTVVDIGCGLGYFSLAMAQMVGPRGRVIALDSQAEMLVRARARARRRGVDGVIDFRRCAPDDLGLSEPADFVLAFWMLHEVRDPAGFLAQVRSALEPSGRLLVVEPKVHVPSARFARTVAVIERAGFATSAGPAVRLSRSLLCTRSG